mmetsp:Transcript_8448/g.13299  ORF Transcript_8448/g.13299 Transcript_8448/m.13299 type:complete len:235 (+) Transcript_8448:1230-1934(+)
MRRDELDVGVVCSRKPRNHRALLGGEHLVGVELLPPVCDHLRSGMFAVRLRAARGRACVVRDAAAVPVVEHDARRRDHVRDPPFLELPLDAPHLPQEVVHVLEAASFVHDHELLVRAPAQDLAHGRDGIRQALHLDAVAQRGDARGLAQAGRKHHAGGVDELDVLVQHDLLGHLGEPRRVAHRSGGAATLQAVDHRRLADVGEAHDTHGDGRLEVAIARVVLKQLEQRLATQCV